MVEKEGVGKYPIGQIVDLVIFETIRMIRVEKNNSVLKNFDNKRHLVNDFFVGVNVVGCYEEKIHSQSNHIGVDYKYQQELSRRIQLVLEGLNEGIGISCWRSLGMTCW